MTPRAPVPHWAVMAAKNEGIYLLEWIAYHRLIGFDHILIYTNDNDDRTVELLQRLDGLPGLHWQESQIPEGGSPQRIALADAFRRLNGSGAWVFVADADEFLVLPEGARVQDLTARHADTDCLSLRWRIFGSSGRIMRRAGLVTERFTRAARMAHDKQRQFKSLTRMSDTWRGLGIHRPLPREGAAFDWRDGDGAPAQLAEDGLMAANCAPGRLALGQVNHYVVKSVSELRAKRRRGHGNVPTNAHVFNDHYFVEFDDNAEADRRIAPRLTALRADMARLTAEYDLADLLEQMERDWHATAPGLLGLGLGRLMRVKLRAWLKRRG